MRINFDFADLEAFLAVRETGSFHLAAERLNLSQSAVTRRVRKLEEALGALLFERTTRAVRPTLAAKRLQSRAEAILGDAEETARAMRDESVTFQHQRNAVVTVAVLPTVVAALIPPALTAFRAQGHHARLRILDHAANELAEAVAQGEADFGIGSIPLLEPSTVFEPLFDDPIMAVQPEGHALAGDGPIRWDEMQGHDLILPAKGTGNRLLIDEAMARARLPLGWAIEVRRSATALDLVRGGAGIALLPRSAVAEGLVARPVADPAIIRPVGLLSRAGQSDSAPVAALKTAVRAVSGSRLRG